MPLVNMSTGEVFDRMCIEKVRHDKCVSHLNKIDKDKLALTCLQYLGHIKDFVADHSRFAEDAQGWLLHLHGKLWDLEDNVREGEDNPPGIQLARYQDITEFNDLRARIKRKINELSNSDQELKQHGFSDEKIYPDILLNLVGPGTSTEVLSSV